jgi:DNA-binding GntR family transcriptional regulator
MRAEILSKPSLETYPDTERGKSVATAYVRIRELIVCGRLSPGAWVVEADLADRLNLSRTPIRSAMHLLQREGYIIEQKGRTKSRMMVSPLTKEDAQELYSIVGHLEGLAGRQIAALPRELRLKTTAVLERINSELEEIANAKKDNRDAIFQLDTNFHRTIAEANSGPRLLQMLHIIKPQIERYSRLYASGIIDSLHHSVQEHRSIISAIDEGDVAKVETALHTNWMNGANRLFTLIQYLGERGTW